MQAASCPDFRTFLKRALSFIVAAAAAAAGVAAAQAPHFPARPLRIIIPFPPGGSVDEAVRIASTRLAEVMGQNVIIDNRPGASGNLGTDLAARAAADGHIVLATTLPLVVNPSLFGKLNHDVLRDFSPVSLLAAAPFVMVVHPVLPVSSVREFIAYARVRPGELNYASAGSGTNLHVAAELFKNVAKLSIVHVPYKGGGPALAAVLGGETHLSFIGVLPAIQTIRSGRLRALGVTALKRSPGLPEVPTIAEGGLPGYEFTSWYGVLAPRGVPGDRVVALNGHFRNALRSADMEERFARAGAEIIASTPEQFGKHLRAELAKWAKVVKEAGLKAE
jgi:tripartite-type tricarboxylate transporter receptor subunit TctC